MDYVVYTADNFEMKSWVFDADWWETKSVGGRSIVWSAFHLELALCRGCQKLMMRSTMLEREGPLFYCIHVSSITLGMPIFHCICTFRFKESRQVNRFYTWWGKPILLTCCKPFWLDRFPQLCLQRLNQEPIPALLHWTWSQTAWKTDGFHNMLNFRCSIHRL